MLDALVKRFGAVRLLIFCAVVVLAPGLASLPPMDRDEPRFAQASKQMLESFDFVDIRFGDEARNKKPVGIYWMQAAAVWAGEALGVADARREIWLYRVPSLLGGVATALFTYWTALALTSRAGAVAAGLLSAASLLLNVESRLATTDAVLAATVVAAMGALARGYLRREGEPAPGLPVAVLFWASLGVGILIKGPITPMVVGLAALVLSVDKRSLRWLLALRPLAGTALCLLIFVPWFALILVRTRGAFLTEAIGHDLLAKVAEAQELHGAPPGSYLAATWISGWPIAPFVALAAPSLWRHRRDPRVRFALAWLIPSWIVFESVPTKLFHYVLPLYPALAILATSGLDYAARDARPHRWASAAFLFLTLALVPLLVLAVIFATSGWLWTLSPATVAGAIGSTLCCLAIVALASRALLTSTAASAAALAAAAALPVYLFSFGWLLTPAVSDRLAIAPRLAQAAAGALGSGCPDPLYATVGDREPSLMFVTDARLLMTDPGGAARFLAGGQCRVAFVERREEDAFVAALAPALDVEQASRVSGVAINGGKRLDVGIYIRR